MTSNPSRTAILLFAKTAPLEACHKTLLSNQNDNGQLTEQLLKHAKDVAQGSELDWYHIHEGQQVDGTFGQKLSHAVESVYKKGHESVIIIGSDCVELTIDDIKQAQYQLQKGVNVFGPDLRGGAFLIGWRRESFNQKAFEDLQWNTSNLLQDLKSHSIQSDVSYECLSVHADINDQNDLTLVASYSKLLRALISWSRTSYEYKYPNTYFTSILSNLSTSRRGPPAVA